MGQKLAPAIKSRNNIDHLIKSGAIASDLAEGYSKNKLIHNIKKGVVNSTIESIVLMASWYEHGTNGFEKDNKKAEELRDKG